MRAELFAEHASGPSGRRRSLDLAVISAALICAAARGGEPSPAAAPPAGSEARVIRGVGKAPGGICLVVGRCGAGFAAGLAGEGRFFVQVLLRSEAGAGDLRRRLRRMGLSHTVAVEVGGCERLPCADSLLNEVVVPDWKAAAAQGLSCSEVGRVLAPLGELYAGGAPEGLAAGVGKAGMKLRKSLAGARTWLRAARPWPQDIDEWTHFLHGADGNPVARDRVVGPPKRLQWTTGPTWMRSHESDSSISSLVTAGGRIFAIVDQAPASIMGERRIPGKWALLARDAFNGRLLWRVPIRRWGWQEWKPLWFSSRAGDFPLNIQKRLVAVGDRVYATLGFRAPVSRLDSASGKVLGEYPGTAGAIEILHSNGILLVAVLDSVDPRPYAQRDPAAKPGRVHVCAFDAQSGRRLWKTEKAYAGSTVDYLKFRCMHGGRFKAARLDPALDLATDGKTVALLDGTHLVGLDFKSGRQLWRSPFPAGKKLWVGTLILAGDVVLHSSPNHLAAFSARDGKLLWKQRKSRIGHLWYSWKELFVIDGLAWTWGPRLGTGTFKRPNGRRESARYPKVLMGYDLKTGQSRRQVQLGSIFNANHHHRCYRNKATVRYVLAGRRGTEFVSLEGGRHTAHNWVRGMCHLGVMPANGLQYVPPHPCACYIAEKLNGFLALAPGASPDPAGESGQWERQLGSQDRLTRGPAFGHSGAVAEPDDWPAFRGDGLRRGSSAAQLGGPLRLLWKKRPATSAAAPIAVGGAVYLPLPEERRLAALNAADGKELWEFAADGRIDSPPAYSRGNLFFGSAGGSVYCLRASDGKLAWRFRAAPGRRRMAVRGQPESPWPVHGSVLVAGGKAYFTAGRSSHLDGGMLLGALDAAGGKLQGLRVFSGPEYDSANMKQNFQLPMGKLPDVLAGDARSFFLRGMKFGPDLARLEGKPALMVGAGYLDGAYFKRVPWRYRSPVSKGNRYGRLISFDSRAACILRMFDDLTPLSHKVFFSPGRNGYSLIAVDAESLKRKWGGKLPLRGRAMALTPDRVYLAGAPDVVPEKDPLAAFEGRLGGELYVLDRKDGSERQRLKLPSPPVFNGIAAARGRLFLTLENGEVVCLGR
jgi:outer membrane protein assembly factor BamB